MTTELKFEIALVEARHAGVADVWHGDYIQRAFIWSKAKSGRFTKVQREKLATAYRDASMTARAERANPTEYPHASDCAHWVGESCDCVTGKSL